MIAAAVLVPGAAMADAPNILGQSGYLYTPDGTVMGSGCVAVGYHHAKGDPQIFLRPAAGGGVRAVVVSPNVNSYHLTVGIANHLELGLTAFNTGEADTIRISPNTITTEGGTSFLANAKVALLKPTSPVQIAGGVVDAFDTLQRTAYGYLSLNAGSYVKNVPLIGALAKKMRLGPIARTLFERLWQYDHVVFDSALVRQADPASTDEGAHRFKGARQT